MTKTDIERMEELQDQVSALQQVLLALFTATIDLVPAIGDDAFAVARAQADACRREGEGRKALRIDLLVEALKEVRDARSRDAKSQANEN